MRLINPAPGECADRQTILQLKMKAADTGEVSTRQENVHTKEEGELQGTGGSTVYAVNRTIISGASEIDLSPFAYEHEAIQRYLELNWFPNYPKVGDTYDALFDQLAEVNEKLWKLEDEARVLRAAKKDSATVYRAATVLFEITENNDQRSELVQKLNELFGVRVQEKVYAQ